MGQKKDWVIWNETKIKIAELLNSKKDEKEIANTLDCGVTVIRQVKKALKLGQPLPGQDGKSENKDEEAPATTKAPQETKETTEATLLKFIPKVQSLALTPNMFIGFMCAKKKGFEGELEDFLDLTALDFWQGRNVNPYEEVSGIVSKKDK